MSREDVLTEDEAVNLKNALEHIEELEIEIGGGTYAVSFNDSD